MYYSHNNKVEYIGMSMMFRTVLCCIILAFSSPAAIAQSGTTDDIIRDVVDRTLDAARNEVHRATGGDKARQNQPPPGRYGHAPSGVNEETRRELRKPNDEHARKIAKLERELERKLEKAKREFRREAARENKRDKIRKKRKKLRDKVNKAHRKFEKKLAKENARFDDKQAKILLMR